MTTIAARSLAVLLTLLLAAAPLQAQALPKAPSSEAVGLSAERLGRITTVMRDAVRDKRVAGTVTLVLRDGQVAYFEAAGSQDAERGTAMKTDTIFRIASMTKAVASVGLMMLVEEGRLSISDPVSKYIPAFAKTTVLEELNGRVAVVPAKRQITIRDLLTHRSGLTYGFLDNAQAGNAYRQTSVSDGLTVVEVPLAENIDRLAKAPLVSQPGAEWHYSLSTDVLGRVAEVASGMTFEQFLSDRILAPLHMVDTSFSVPDAKWSRFVNVYTGSFIGLMPPWPSPV